MSSSNCCFLTCIQVSQEAGQVVWYSHLFQNFPQFIVIHIVKGFGVVNKAEIYVFLELSCFLDDPEDIGNLISGSSALSKTSLNIWTFTVHVLLKPGLENFEDYFTRVWEEFLFMSCVLKRRWDKRFFNLNFKNTEHLLSALKQCRNIDKTKVPYPAAAFLCSHLPPLHRGALWCF